MTDGFAPPWLSALAAVRSEGARQSAISNADAGGMQVRDATHANSCGSAARRWHHEPQRSEHPELRERLRVLAGLRPLGGSRPRPSTAGRSIFSTFCPPSFGVHS